jgi:hypothetical protein
MKYLGKKFNSPANSAEYVKNWDAVFGEATEQPDCTAAESSQPEDDRERQPAKPSSPAE